MNEPYLSPLRIAKLIGVSPHAVRRWCRSVPPMPHLAKGNKIKALESVAREWMRREWTPVEPIQPKTRLRSPAPVTLPNVPQCRNAKEAIRIGLERARRNAQQ